MRRSALFVSFYPVTFFSFQDSLVCEFKHHDPYALMRNQPQHFDLSNLPADNPFKITPTSKLDAKLGTMKLEYGTRITTKWACPAAKVYCNVFDDDDDEEKRAKGVNRCVVQRELQFDHYEDCVRSGVQIVREQCSFRSKNHKIFSVAEKKVCLGFVDDKRRHIDDFESVPWGFWVGKRYKERINMFLYTRKSFFIVYLSWTSNSCEKNQSRGI